MKRAVVVGLVWFLATAAEAQAPQPSPAPAAPAAPCSLVSQNGDQFTDTPLFGFDPSVVSRPLPVPTLGVKAGMVVCTRTTLIPELTDYRVLTEMHVPLAIKAGTRTLFLGFSDGRLQIGVQDGDITSEEKTALQTRLGDMQTAMAAKLGAKAPAK